MEPQRVRLSDRMRDILRTRHYSPRTEKTYLQWARRFVDYHHGRSPTAMGTDEVRQFLTHLATQLQVSAATQNQALNALVFLYSQVLGREIGTLNAVRARRSQRLPVVLTKDQTLRVLDMLSGTPRLMASLLYGAGLRLCECLGLRVKDIDFDA